jgi:hypothetical protein
MMMSISSSWDWFIFFAVATFIVWLMIILQSKLDTGYRDSSPPRGEDQED